MNDEKQIKCPCGGTEFELYSDGIKCTSCKDFRQSKKPTRKGHKLKVQGSIYYNEITLSKKAKEAIKKFREENDGNELDITFEVHNHVEHWQYRLLYGFIYKAIADGEGIATAIEEGEVDFNDPGMIEVDKMMKERLLFVAVNDEREIPDKHWEKCKSFYLDYKDENGDIKRRCWGYIPSKTTLTLQEMGKYIKQCENVMMGYSGWDIKDVLEYNRIRSLALKEK